MSPEPDFVYLDHAATTPMCEEAIQAMAPYLHERFANPSGSYSAARRVRRELEEARESFADLVGCEGRELYFTSGGTESDNLAVIGAYRARPGLVVVSAAEHKAVLESAASIGATTAPVDTGCRIDLEAIGELVDPSTTLVSVMAVNNEIGTIQPIDDVVTTVKERAPQVLVHTDAVQAFAFLDVAAFTKGCDLVSYSAHKFAGPKGIGALVIRESARPFVAATHLGGAQERERRAGTENVAGVIAMAAAARRFHRDRAENVARVTALRDRLAGGLIDIDPSVVQSAPLSACVAGTCHVRFPGVSAEELLIVLDELGVGASAGSACASGALEPSHVLLAMGASTEQAKEAIRFSLGWTTTQDDVERATSAVGKALSRLRSV